MSHDVDDLKLRLLLLMCFGLGGVACGTEPPAGGKATGGTSGTSGAGPNGGSGGINGTGGTAGSGGGAGGFASGGGGSSGAAGGPGAEGGGGSGATAGFGGSESGTGGAGGTSGVGGSGGGDAGASGAAGTSAGSGGSGPGTDTRPWFSFFTTSMTGLLSIAPDPMNGFGGDLRFGEATGLAGADKICTTLARMGNPGDTKVWRAFLSTYGHMGGEQVDAIDRVGPGPWYDYNGRLLSMTKEGLIPAMNGRPAGDAQLMEMFTDENGSPVREEMEDDHDTLTGSNKEGRLYDASGADPAVATCNDWTSNTLRSMTSGGGGPGGGGGQVPVGHSWPRSSNNGRHWIQDHTVNGCEPGVFIGGGGGAPPDNFTVGGGGGYGAFYCFALGATPPPP